MEKVQGIGGVFIYANDPEALAAWYTEHLGIETENYGKTYYHAFAYRYLDDPERRASTTWSIMPAKKKPLPKARKAMVNYRVENLQKLLDQLADAGIEIESVEDYDYGRFAWIYDPEGNRIELFEDHFDYDEMLNDGGGE